MRPCSGAAPVSIVHRTAKAIRKYEIAVGVNRTNWYNAHVQQLVELIEFSHTFLIASPLQVSQFI